MIGRTLAHFHILEKIGEGGMGVVYRAEDTRLHRMVALKILPPEVLGNEERRLRFLREARAAAAVSDPHIATVYDIGEVDGVVFIAMELVEGKTLRALLGGRPLPVRQAVDIALQVAQGLEKAHRAHVIHRDLKPDNIVVGPDGQAKILDFGLAKLLEDDEEKGNAEVSRLRTISREMTRAGKILGTAAYMSPEQARGEAIDARSDLFSFGVTLYEMVTGRQPFQGRTDTDVLIAIVRDQPVPPAQANPDVPAELAQIIVECLEKDPADRCQHADQVAVDLRRLKRSSDSGLQKVPTPPSIPAVTGAGSAGALRGTSGRRVLLASGVAVLLAGLGLTAWWGLRPAPVRFRQGDRILVTDLENDTGRAEIGTALRLALEERLLKSSYARPIVGEARDRLAAAPAGETSHALSPGAAEDACGRKECAAYLTGAVSSDGPAFRMKVLLRVAGGGGPFKEWTVAVPDEAGLLQAVHDLALNVRRVLGENPQAVAGTPPPTTRSLPAYQAYATASLSAPDNQNAIALMKRAIEIDPGFTDAYTILSFIHWNLGDFREWRRLAREAVRLSEGRSEQTRLLNEINILEATYDIDRLMERNKAYTRLYPFDLWGPLTLGLNYDNYYQNIPAAEAAHRAAYRLGADEMTFDNLSINLRQQGKAGQIEELVADYRSRGGDENAARRGEARAHLARGDWNGAEETLRPLLQGPPAHRMDATMMQVSALVYAGRIHEAERASADAWRLAVEGGDLRQLHSLGMERVWLALHRTGVASSPTDEELRMVRGDLRHLRDLAALSVDTRLAEPLGRLTREHEEYEKDNPSRYVRDTLQFVHACQDLVRGDALRAVDLLTPLARNSDLVEFHHVLGRALEAHGQWRAAAAAYEDALRHRYSRHYLFSAAAWILDQHRLAGIYERLGDRPRARQWYEKFLADWKDGDPDIPEIVDARKRVQELAGGSAPAAPPAGTPTP